MKRTNDSMSRLIAFALLLNAAFLGMRCSSSSDLSVAEADSPELLARVDALEDGLNEVRSVPAVDTSEILARVAALEASTTSLTQTVGQIQSNATELSVRVDTMSGLLNQLQSAWVTSLPALSASVNGHTEEIAGVVTRVDSLETDLEQLRVEEAAFREEILQDPDDLPSLAQDLVFYATEIVFRGERVVTAPIRPGGFDRATETWTESVSAIGGVGGGVLADGNLRFTTDHAANLEVTVGWLRPYGTVTFEGIGDCCEQVTRSSAAGSGIPSTTFVLNNVEAGEHTIGPDISIQSRADDTVGLRRQFDLTCGFIVIRYLD